MRANSIRRCCLIEYKRRSTANMASLCMSIASGSQEATSLKNIQFKAHWSKWKGSSLVNRLGSDPRHVCVKSLGTFHSLFRHSHYHKDAEKLKEGQKSLLPQPQRLERLNSGWNDLNEHTGSLDLYHWILSCSAFVLYFP